MERAKNEVANLRNKIEDELAGGARLDETAQKLKVPYRTIEAVDRSGRGPDGNPVTGLPQGASILPGAFSTDVGVENDPARSGAATSGMRSSELRPPRTLARRGQGLGRDAVARGGSRNGLKVKADEMVTKLNAGDKFADVGRPECPSKCAKDIRGEGRKILPPDVVGAAFRTNKDPAGTAEGKNATERYVFRVTNIVLPTFDKSSPEAKRISDALTRAVANELLAQYVARVESNLGTRINQAALNQATRHQRQPVMQVEPAADVFAQTYARGEAQVVWTTLVADLETPVSAFLKVASESR